MSHHNITEYVTSPTVALPIGGAALAGFIGYLPIIINFLVGIYFFMMVVHKAYQMWKEWKADKRGNDACS